MKLTRLRCPNCGADFENVDVTEDQKVFKCTRLGCGASFILDQGVKFADIKQADAEKIEHYREELKRSLSPFDRHLAGRYAENILTILPDDYRAKAILAIAQSGEQSSRPLYYFLQSDPACTPEEFEEVFPCLLEHCDYRGLNLLRDAVSAVEPVTKRRPYFEKISRQTDYLKRKVEDYADIPRDIFVCHSSDDLGIVMKVVNALEADGNKCWYSERNMPPDSLHYWEKIRKAIRRCTIFLVCGSGSAMMSDPVQTEIEFAEEAKVKRLELKLDDAPHTSLFKHFFDGISWVKLDDDFDGAMRQLKEFVYQLKHAERNAEEKATQKKAEEERLLAELRLKQEKYEALLREQEEEKQRLEELRRQEEARQKQEEQRKREEAEQLRLAGEKRLQEASERRRLEAERLLEEQRLAAEAERERQEAEQRKAAEEENQRKAEEERKLQDEAEQLRLADEKRLLEEAEHRRLESEHKWEELRKAAMTKLEQENPAEEERKQREEQERLAEEKRLQEEAERQRLEAEQHKAAEEENQRKAEEERKQQEEAEQRRLEAEKRRKEEDERQHLISEKRWEDLRRAAEQESQRIEEEERKQQEEQWQSLQSLLRRQDGPQQNDDEFEEFKRLRDLQNRKKKIIFIMLILLVIGIYLLIFVWKPVITNKSSKTVIPAKTAVSTATAVPTQKASPTSAPEASAPGALQITSWSITINNYWNIGWRPVTDADKYEIYYQIGDTGERKFLASTVGTSLNIIAPVSGGKAVISGRACKGDVCGAFGETWYYVYPTAVPTKTRVPTKTPAPVSTALPLATFSELNAGDEFTFGSYEQDNDLTNGTEPIEWQVLTVEDGRALVISKYTLDYRQYHSSAVDVTWQTCALRTWLNEEFLNNAFSDAEKSRIAEVRNNNPDSSKYLTEGGNDTEDLLFLLSIDEADQYFSSASARKGIPTTYAIARNTLENTARNRKWMLRSPGEDKTDAAYVNSDGQINKIGSSVTSVNAVRPAFWLELTDAPKEAPVSVSVSAGDMVTLGRYEQDNDLTNGSEPVEWLVLAVEDDWALLISRYGLEAMKYNETEAEVTWATCSLRQWLWTFYESTFNASEKTKVRVVITNTPDNPYGAEGGREPIDLIFLLSIDEVNRYMPTADLRQCEATDHVIQDETWSDRYFSWWLRSPGIDNKTACDVDSSGSVTIVGLPVDTLALVRPALWMKLSE